MLFLNNGVSFNNYEGKYEEMACSGTKKSKIQVTTTNRTRVANYSPLPQKERWSLYPQCEHHRPTTLCSFYPKRGANGRVAVVLLNFRMYT